MDLLSDLGMVEVWVQLVDVVLDDAIAVTVYSNGSHGSDSKLVKNVELFLVFTEITFKSVDNLKNFF